MLVVIAKVFISPKLNTRQGEFLKVLNEFGLKIGHPDVLYINNEEKLGVEASKRVREFLSLKPYSAQIRMILIESAQNFTEAAQNSLLKTLEELPEGSTVLLGVEKESQLLPTILSRCEIVILSKAEDIYSSSGLVNHQNDKNGQVEKLLGMSLDDRFEFVEKLEDKDGFLKDLTEYFGGKKLEEKNNLEFAKKLLEANKWASTNANMRAILEYLMLELPER